MAEKEIPYAFLYLKDGTVTDADVANLIRWYGEETKIHSRIDGEKVEYFEGERHIPKEEAYCLLRR
jgi:hypothetical protein